jgi:hypothetical protein
MTGMRSSFTWSSVYGNRVDVGFVEGRKEEQWKSMKEAMHVPQSDAATYGTHARSPFTKTWSLPKDKNSAPPAVKSFSFARPKLASQEYGETYDPKFSNRVPVSEWKKMGGPCVHALTLDDDGDGHGGERKETNQVDAVNKYVDSKAAVLGLRNDVASELEAIDRLIDLNKSSNAETRKRAVEAVQRLAASTKACVPLAKSFGRFQGDMSLAEMEKAKNKPVTKAAVTSDEMKSIMRNDKGVVNWGGKPVHRNARMTQEATYAEWKNELGKH